MSGTRTPTVVLGFDGLAFEYLDAFHLPHFSRLRERGVEVPLRSTFPPWTGTAWPSMYTGTEPSHHGVYDFFDFGNRPPDEADLVTRNDVEAPALWNYLTARDVPAIVLNVPVTHPAEPIDGVLVPGYLATEDADGYPPGIRDELAEAVGEYRIYSRAETEEGGDKLGAYIELIELRRRAAEHLLANYDWGLALVQIQKTDAVFHQYSDESAFRAIYQVADELLGAVLDGVDEDANVVVCSDHGIGTAAGYQIYLNQVLADAGFVETTSEAAEIPTLGQRKRRLVGGNGGGGQTDGVTAAALTAAQAVLRRLGMTPGDVYAAARRVGMASTLEAHLPEDALDSVGQGIDWRQSRAYCRSGNELGVRINLRGRESHGVVPESAYETTRDELVALLSGLQTPDGEPAFEWVEPREAVYGGPRADDACDVLFLPTAMNHTVATNLIGSRFVPIDGHQHKPDGVFIGAGPGFDAAAAVDRLSLVDVAPVIMALLGLPVPDRMTGAVPPGLLSADVTRADYGDVPYGAAPAAGSDDGEVEKRLEDLGYL